MSQQYAKAYYRIEYMRPVFYCGRWSTGSSADAADVTIIREYDSKLAHINVYGNEPNQAWTNLIDNAIDGIW